MLYKKKKKIKVDRDNIARIKINYEILPRKPNLNAIKLYGI